MSIFIKKRTFFVFCMLFLGIGALYTGFGGFSRDYHQSARDSAGNAGSKSEFQEAMPGESGLESGAQGGQVEAVVPGFGIDDSKDAAGFFVEYRLERERTRGQQLEMLREVISNSGSDSETGQQAREQLLVISANMARESEVESLIRARGYKDAAAYVDRKGITVIIRAKDIPGEEMARVKELVSRSTGVQEQDILVITKG